MMKKKYLDFLRILILIGFSGSVTSQNSFRKVEFEYLTFEKFAGSSREFLVYFKIKNNTRDTLYLSRKNIVVLVNKNGKTLENQKSIPNGQTIYKVNKKNKRFMDAEYLQEEQTDLFRHKFAEKLYNKNFSNVKSVKNKEFIIEVIENDCIVILPNKIINYSQIFNNNQFNKTYTVKAKYQNNKIFTYYMSGGGEKRVNIKV